MFQKRITLSSSLVVIGLITVSGLFIQLLSVHSRQMYKVQNKQHGLRSSAPTDVTQNHTDDVAKKVSGLEFLTGNWRQTAAIFPTANLTNRLLTIGIPTIRRENTTYIFDTIESLFNCSTESELDDVYIVIFLADFSKEWKENMSRTLRMKYPGPIRTGMLQVIQASAQFYPPFTNLNHTYKAHPMAQRKWRAKQNFDYAFVFMYSQPLSTYYLQLEDDVYTVPGYVSSIRYHLMKDHNWVCLEFSELGFIGKAYHSNDLEKLAKMILLFYVEQPGDFTYLHFNIMMLQFRRRIIYPTLFQHRGLQSSLRGKIQSLKDKHFETMQRQFNGDNPPAKFYTTIRNINTDSPLFMAYNLAGGEFWTNGPLKVNETITIVFDTPHHIDQVIIITGSTSHPTDRLYNGTLEASLSLMEKNNAQPVCTKDIFLGTFEDGKINATHLYDKLSLSKVHCLRITVKGDQKWWLIVRDIAVFTVKTSEKRKIQ